MYQYIGVILLDLKLGGIINMCKNTLALFLSVIFSAIIFTAPTDKPIINSPLQTVSSSIEITDLSAYNNCRNATKEVYWNSLNPHYSTYKSQQSLLNVEDVLRLLICSSIY